MYPELGKRLFDLVCASIAVVLLSPLLIIVAISIKLTDPGPILFSHNRIGRDGKPFRFYKFRSMPVGTPKVPSDSLGEVQISPFGRFMRRTNIDELPQLINILKGDMSVVGPRPPLPDQEELIARRRQNGALALRPGLTGLAQIRAYDGMSVSEKAAFDAEYARSIGLARDIAIILRTMFYLFKPPPVY